MYTAVATYWPRRDASRSNSSPPPAYLATIKNDKKKKKKERSRMSDIIAVLLIGVVSSPTRHVRHQPFPLTSGITNIHSLIYRTTAKQLARLVKSCTLSYNI